MEKKNKLIRYLFIFAIIAVIFTPVGIKYINLSLKNKELESKIKVLESFNSKLKVEKQKLKNDLDYIEKVARKKMGIVKKGEVIYKIEE